MSEGGCYVQCRGQEPGRIAPDPPSSQEFKYGDLTARGTAGGLAGVKLDAAAPGLAAMAAKAASIVRNLMVLLDDGQRDGTLARRGELSKRR